MFCQFINFAQTYKLVKDTAALKLKIEVMSKATTSIESDFTQEKNLIDSKLLIQLSSIHFYSIVICRITCNNVKNISSCQPNRDPFYYFQFIPYDCTDLEFRHSLKKVHDTSYYALSSIRPFRGFPLQTFIRISSLKRE